MRDIGRPKGSGNEDSVGLQEWKLIFERFFTAPPGANEDGNQEESGDTSKFEEDEIDAMREQKLRELEEYRRQVQLEQHQNKKRASMASTRKKSVSSGDPSSKGKRSSAFRRSSVF